MNEYSLNSLKWNFNLIYKSKMFNFVIFPI